MAVPKRAVSKATTGVIASEPSVIRIARTTHAVRVTRATRAVPQRERAARALEAQADAEIAAGRFDEALDRLERLRRTWPDRAGLVAQPVVSPWRKRR